MDGRGRRPAQQRSYGRVVILYYYSGLSAAFGIKHSAGCSVTQHVGQARRTVGAREPSTSFRRPGRER